MDDSGIAPTVDRLMVDIARATNLVQGLNLNGHQPTSALFHTHTPNLAMSPVWNMSVKAQYFP
jgi:hypothetical protein